MHADMGLDTANQAELRSTIEVALRDQLQEHEPLPDRWPYSRWTNASISKRPR